MELLIMLSLDRGKLLKTKQKKINKKIQQI